MQAIFWSFRTTKNSYQKTKLNWSLVLNIEDKKISIETLLEESRPIVMKKKEFAYRDASMFLTHVEFFWKSEFEIEDQSEWFFYPTVFLRFYNFPLKNCLKN